MLGLAYNDNADPKAAAEALQTAVTLAPQFAPAQAELGHAYAYQSRFPEAIARFRIARRLDPQSRDYLFALGEALGMNARSQEQYQEAAAVQEECLKQTPDNGNLLFTLGQLHLRFMNLEEAYRCLKQAAERRPNNAKAWYNLGRVEQLRGHPEEAARADALFKKEIALHENAILAVKKVLADLKDPVARLELSRRFRAEGNLRGAYTQLKTALALKPDFAKAQIEMGRFAMEYQQGMGQENGTPSKPEDAGPPPPEELLSSRTGKALFSRP
jgi:tetratricopeptide (TPR) repeat protein